MKRNFWKIAILGWNGNKILLILKWIWIFMESDCLWINMILEVSDISNSMYFWEVALNHLFLQSQNRLCFLEKTSSGRCHLLLHTLQRRVFPCLPNDEDTWDYACGQNWLAAWFIDLLYYICAAYFQPLLGWIKMLENLSNLWVLRFHSEPWGTKALSNVIT